MGRMLERRMLKLWILKALICASLWGPLIAVSGGDYYISLDKIDNQPELSREYADWHLFIRRINKKDKVIDGYYIVKKDIRDPKLLMTSYILSNNKFYKMALNELVPTNLCDQMIKKDFIDTLLVGNSSFSVPPDCVIRPGYMKLRHADNFDVMVHRMMNKTIYGTYKVVAKIMNRENKTVGGGTWVVTMRKRN